jgi:ketosteroid isomerase-like protein
VSQETVKAMFGAIDACDWTALARLYAEDCTYDRPGFETVRGLSALIRFYADLRPIRSGRHRVVRFLEDDDGVCASGRFDGVLRTGEAISLEFADLYTIRNDLISSRKTFFFTPLT